MCKIRVETKLYAESEELRLDYVKSEQLRLDSM